MASIIRVFTPGPFWQPLDYLLPTHYTKPPKIGARVAINLRNQELVGIVAGVSFESHIPAHKLKWLNKIIDEEPLFDKKQLDFLQWIADYYHAPMGDVCHMAMPKLLREGKETLSFGKTRAIRLTAHGKTVTEKTFKRSPKQAQLWQRLMNAPFLPVHQIKSLGINHQIIKKLLQLDVIEYFMVDIPIALRALGKASCAGKTDTGLNQAQSSVLKDDEYRTHHQPEQEMSLEQSLTLTKWQEEALRRILSGQNIFQVFLLNGITGSGKTEVYLQVIQALVKQGQQALVLVPEIGLTPQTVERFVRRFGCGVVALHSGLNDNERTEAWLAAKNGSANVIIGTRSSIFAPFKNLGIIIIDEEHDASFKQHDGIRYSARDAAVVLSNLLNIPIVLGSATPSFESWLNASKNRYIRIDLPERSAGAAIPSWHFIDLRNKNLQEGLSQELLDAMTKHLNNNKQVLLFLNRRGFAPSWLCPQCGWSPNCTHCDTALTYHTKPLKLACHHCGHTDKIPFNCKKCQGKMQPLGLGTQRIEQALTEYFPHIPIIRIDRDSTARKNSFEQIVDQIHQGHPQILLGTQMVAKGHHFPQVTLVGVLNADGGLYSADFRAPEHVAQLILQVAGRAGRAEHHGEVYIQTYWPDHPMWQDLIQEKGYERFAETSLRQREMALLPPFRFAALLRAEAKQAQIAEQFLTTIALRAKAMASKNVALLGPIAALQAKRAGFYRSQLLLISSNRAELQLLLKKWIPEISADRQSHKIRWHIDVDPMAFD